MGVVNFNGVSTNSSKFSAPILVETPPDYTFPSRDANFTHVPGRDGDVLVDNGSYNNVTRTYNLAIGDEDIDYARLAYELSDWLHSANGYAKLTDSYDPEHYCMAAFIDEGSIVNILQHAGRISVSFNCKPQRYLISGDKKINVLELPGTNYKKLVNPTRFWARPLIHVHTVNNLPTTIEISRVYSEVHDSDPLSNQSITITPNTSYPHLYIDSELMDCYSVDETTWPHTIINRNSDVVFSKSVFPILKSGLLYFEHDSGINMLEVTPRWWTI